MKATVLGIPQLSHLILITTLQTNLIPILEATVRIWELHPDFKKKKIFSLENVNLGKMYSCCNYAKHSSRYWYYKDEQDL